MTDESSLKTAFDEVAAKRGSAGLELLVVNAGIGVGGPLEYVSQAEWRQQLDVNVFGVVLSIRHALPLLRAPSSRIIVVGSINSGRIAAAQSLCCEQTRACGTCIFVATKMAARTAHHIGRTGAFKPPCGRRSSGFPKRHLSKASY
ncbi:MAG: hypothetical protein Ct9H300mP26_3760 [Acidimicrobiales bacterium]|nr:MAG: hypothetical protein Ct9H300mP26_3760 [Acidimicrobiales bacterium]